MESKFKGRLIGLIGVNILCFIIIVFTLAIAFPAAVCIKQRWIAKNTIIDGKRLIFDGNGWQLFAHYMKWFLLTIITLGIYSLWLSIKMKQWIVSHTHFVEDNRY